MENNRFINKNIIVLGLAKTGYSTAQLLLKLGANVTVSALNIDIEEAKLNNLISKGANVIIGPHPLDLLEEKVDLIVKNPGIPYDIPFIKKALTKEVDIISEVELVSGFMHDLIVITGSNGKTTTTTLIHEIISKSKEAITCGNIGRPLTDVVLKNEEHKVLVCELSSFQLKGTVDFKPNISILINIDQAHLDYHNTFADYIDSKAKITKNQTSSDFLIYNFDDSIVADIGKKSNAISIPFSTTQYLKFGACVVDNWIFFNGERYLNTKDIALPGKHNQENILAAIITAKLHNIPDNIIKETISTFTGVKHRLQYVKTINGRKFYNDSKATNIKAATNAINSFENKPILIAGGLDRGNSFDSFIPALKKCKMIFVYGEAAEKIMKTAYEHGLNNVIKVDSLEEAVHLSYKSSYNGDIILLSPACASWDQFPNFEIRGEHFIKYINNIENH